MLTLKGQEEEDTYTFHLQLSEEMASHQHAQRDGEDKNKGKRQGCWAGFHEPQEC